MSDDRDRTYVLDLKCPVCAARVEYEWIQAKREYWFHHPGFEGHGTLGGEAVGLLGWHVEMRRLHRKYDETAKPTCIGCGSTEDVLHAEDCSHINGTA